jgi:hypothetical protein
MTDRKACVRCQRTIDQYARICVYCNWDQSQSPDAAPPPVAATTYVPPPDHRARNRLLGTAALVALVIVAFVVGTLIHGFEPKQLKAAESNKENAVAEAAPSSAPKSNVTLVPVSDSGPPAAIEQPITSAPAQAPGQDPNDATALPSDQYAAVAAKAKAQKQARNTPVDPRTLRGHAVEGQSPPQQQPKQPPRDNDPQQQQPGMASQAAAPPSQPVRTEAFPEYKPMPDIHVERDTSARMTLTVGADGRVKDIDVLDPIPGATSKLIETVQNWRFRPATENGTPVTAKVAVTITLHGNGQ